MKLFGSKKRKLIAGGVALVATAGLATGAFAYFTANGNGTGGAATVGDTTGWTVNNFNTSGTDLYPGSGSQTVSYDVTNASAGDQHLNSIVATISVDTASGDAKDAAGNVIAGCKAIWFSVDNTGHAAYATLAASGTESGTAVVTMPSNTIDNQDACRTHAPAVKIVAS
ncbi:MAG TPA: hypothetical protein VEZ15_13165 [Acidimicrobiia bacterium]|nr:hypothetical protein [Acidimicrobiia bacterium]